MYETIDQTTAQKTNSAATQMIGGMMIVEMAAVDAGNTTGLQARKAVGAITARRSKVTNMGRDIVDGIFGVRHLVFVSGKCVHRTSHSQGRR